jgi:hypothetical protein
MFLHFGIILEFGPGKKCIDIGVLYALSFINHYVHISWKGHYIFTLVYYLIPCYRIFMEKLFSQGCYEVNENLDFQSGLMVVFQLDFTIWP